MSMLIYLSNWIFATTATMSTAFDSLQVQVALHVFFLILCQHVSSIRSL